MMNATIAKHLFTEDLYQLKPRVMVLIPSAWSEMPESDQVLLSRILGSVKLSLASVQIVQGASFSIDEAGVYGANIILSFGVPVPGTDRLYEATRISNVDVVVADAMGGLDDVKKKNLWISLKQVFQL